MATKNITDEEREKLVQKLDEDLEKFIISKSKRKVGFDKDKLEQDLKDHPAFISSIPSEGELPPLVEALQALKYDTDENSPEELANNYKDDGNYNFKLKQYRLAIAAYTEGIKQKCTNDDLNSQLYGNRSAAQFYLKNYRQALNDCKKSLKLNQKNLKIHIRGIECSRQLKLNDEALKMCLEGLQEFPDNKVILELETNIKKQKKIDDRNKRKAHVQESRTEKENQRLWEEILKRRLRIKEYFVEKPDEIPNFSDLNTAHPQNDYNKLHLNDEGNLIWPVIFFYPEYSQMDFIQNFNEMSRFSEQLEIMFGYDTPTAPWDKNGNYTKDKLKIYFEDVPINSLISVDQQDSLLKVLSDSRYIIEAATPSFIILSTESEFCTDFLNRYESVL